MDQEKKDDTLIEISAQQGLNQASEFEEELGVTKEYRRELLDSDKRKREYKEKVFKGKKTYKDRITGKNLHKSQKAAQQKYHMKNADGAIISKKWGDYSVETDHVISLKELHERTKDNPFLSDEDLKEIANQDYNYRATSKSFNASKGEKSDFEVIADPDSELTVGGKGELLKGKLVAELNVNAALAARTIKNAGKIFENGAQNALAASAVPLVIRGSQDLIRLANGEMTMKEAMEDVGSLGLSIAASGGSMRVATYALGATLRNSENELLKKFANANEIGTVLVVGSIVARAAGKYLEGEVDAEGFFEEIGESGLSLACGMLLSKTIALVVPGAIAPAIAAMVASAVCQEIHAQAMKFVQGKKANEEIQAIAAAASRGIQEQQEELYRLMDESHAEWANEMNGIFQGIAVGLANNDLSQTNKCLRQLAKSYSAQVSLYDNGEDLIDDLISARNGEKNLHLLQADKEG